MNMEASRDLLSHKVRFYAPLEAMVAAWSVVALALGAALSIYAPVHYTITMVGILAILGVAMRSRAYQSIKPLRP
jgi:hypothetical protein